MAITEIKVTAADNEIILIASTPAGSTKLLHYRSGFNEPVDLTLYPGAVLAPGNYSLTMLGVNWGGPSSFEVQVTTNGKTEKYPGGGSQDVGLVWSNTIPIMVDNEPVTLPYGVPPLTAKERDLIAMINTTWSRDKALSTLENMLQTAIEIELATIPIYLYTYYSIDRTPGRGEPAGRDQLLPTGEYFPKSPLSRYADQAGALIMSVAVEEMLHMSLASNILFALGTMPVLYGKAPGEVPSGATGLRLPGHDNVGPHGVSPLIPMDKLSVKQLDGFLTIEYPATADATPEATMWNTIGQVYSYIRCIICSDHIWDSDFSNTKNEIQTTEYSPNNIDTVYPKRPFDYDHPRPAFEPDSAQSTAAYASDEDSHVREQDSHGNDPWMRIASRGDALKAIATICYQGEGFGPHAYDDPSHEEYSHYYKFLSLQSQLVGYHEDDPTHAPAPPAPEGTNAFGAEDLAKIVYAFPKNPRAEQFDDEGQRNVVKLANALFQYMLIMTETIFGVPPGDQKIYFNRTMHQSMIWVMDKYIRTMRTISGTFSPEVIPGVQVDAKVKVLLPLVPTFANYDLVHRHEAFANLKKLADDVSTNCKSKSWYKDAGLEYYVKQIKQLPDVSPYWKGSTNPPKPAPPPNPPSWLTLPSHPHDAGTGAKDPASRTPVITNGKYSKNQGGCGLYGTAEELSQPGSNDCQSLGSCATPINAERFITDGERRGQSVWLRAREVFKAKVWPTVSHEQGLDSNTLPLPQGTVTDPTLFQYGPTIEWIQYDNNGQGMTACGSSGMSGAGSCS